MMRSSICIALLGMLLLLAVGCPSATDDVAVDDDDEIDDDGDCDDADATVYPGAQELCDGIDNDCDTIIDEDTELDQDFDGFTPCQGDCDDADPAVYPGNGC